MQARIEKYFRQGLEHGRLQGDSGPANAMALRGMLADALKLPEREAVEAAVNNYKRRLDAVPSLIKHPELAGMRDCLMAYERGVAEGARVELIDVMIRANFIHMVTKALRVSTPKATDQATGQPGCTLAYFPDSERGPLLANNQDGVSSAQHTNEPGWIVANKAGIILGTVSSGLFNDEVSPEEFPAPVFMMVYEMCTTTAQVVDLVTRLNLFWGPMNLLIADKKGNSAVVEKSSCRYGLRVSSDGFIGTTEMSAEEPAYKKFLWEKRESSLAPRGLDHTSVDYAYWKACERRSERLMGLIGKAKSAPSMAAIESIIYDHTGEVEAVHMDGMACHPEQKPNECEWSLRTTVWVINEGRAQASFAKPPVSSRQAPKQWFDYRNTEHVF
jgi:hypothetical protein